MSNQELLCTTGGYRWLHELTALAIECYGTATEIVVMTTSGYQILARGYGELQYRDLSTTSTAVTRAMECYVVKPFFPDAEDGGR